VPQREPEPTRVDEPKRDTQNASPTPTGAQADTPPPPPRPDLKSVTCRDCRHSQDVTGQVDAFGVWVCENCSAENRVAVAR
jgi:hypothetical protein